MKNLFTIIGFTIKDMVKRKAFIVSTIIFLVLVVVATNVPTIINSVVGEEGFETTVLIVDNEDVYEGTLKSLENMELDYDYQIAENTLTIDEIKAKINEGEIDEALYIEKSGDTIIINNVVANINTFNPTVGVAPSILIDTYKQLQISKLGLNEAEMASINPVVEYTVSQAEEQEVQAHIGIMMFASMALFMAIYLFAYQVSMSITTEKTSKIMETLVTSTSPKYIVIGKTIGMGLVGLMQVALIITVGIISGSLFLEQEMLASLLNIEEISPIFLVYLFIYFILGFFLYAFLYALTGSTVSKPEDVQSANGPVAILAVVGFYLSYFSMMNPTGEINGFAALFPLSAPFSMPLRIMMGLATPTDIALSIAILVVTVIIIANIAIKIYSSAILNYGTKLSLKDLVNMYRTK